MQFRDFLGQNWETDCLGCSIGNNKITPPGGILLESTDFVLHQDPEIPITGFLIISPKKHVRSIIELKEDQRNELMAFMNIGIQALRDIKISDEITIVQEERSKHLHFWLFPWHAWMDSRFKKSIASLREINEYAKSNCTQNDIAEVMHTAIVMKDYFNKI